MLYTLRLEVNSEILKKTPKANNGYDSKILKKDSAKKYQTSKSPTIIFAMPQTSNILCYPSKYACMHASTFFMAS